MTKWNQCPHQDKSHETRLKSVVSLEPLSLLFPLQCFTSYVLFASKFQAKCFSFPVCFLTGSKLPVNNKCPETSVTWVTKSMVEKKTCWKRLPACLEISAIFQPCLHLVIHQNCIGVLWKIPSPVEPVALVCKFRIIFVNGCFKLHRKLELIIPTWAALFPLHDRIYALCNIRTMSTSSKGGGTIFEGKIVFRVA